MAVTKGSCGKCSKPLVFLKWVNDRIVIAVACEDCKIEVYFDLRRMVSGLEDDDIMDFDQMLRQFNPTGLPN